MKRPLLFVLSLFMLAVPLHAAPSAANWKKVDKLMEKQLPKSAVELLVPMEAAARAAKDWPEAVRATATRILIESGIEEDRPELRLEKLAAAMADVPPEMLPFLQVLEAEWLYEYFAENEWDIMERTPGAGGASFVTWDVKRFLTEVDARFVKVLALAPQLQQTPVAQWSALLPAGRLPDSYQPTLYDFVAGEALTFYTMGSQTATPVQDEFVFEETSPALGPMEEFLAWQPAAGEGPERKAIRLFQEMMNFHRNDPDPGALVMLDLQRLEWARQRAGLPAAERVLQQYTALYQKHATHEVSLRARSLAAHVLHDPFHNSVEARKILQEGLAIFEKSLFASRCRDQIHTIESRDLSVTTEFVWNAAQPEIVMDYRNLKQVFFRLYLESAQPDLPTLVAGTYVDGKKGAAILKKRPLRAWLVDLPPAEDYRKHRHRVPAPGGLAPGHYLLCASGDARFSSKDNEVTATRVLVTPLALVTRERSGHSTDAWVLDAVSGEPLQGAEVTLWDPASQKEKPKQVAQGTTDSGGFVSLAPPQEGRFHVFARLAGHCALAPQVSAYDGRPARDSDSTFFFTDRAIYRPGQIIQFKGIHVHHDQGRSDYRTLSGVPRHIVLKDTGGVEIAALDTVTNDFGSFSGSFTFPRRGLTGKFRISDGAGHSEFSVEEYKRPKFHVEVDPPALPPQLGTEVTVKVRALAYTGTPVDGADVRWHVQREGEGNSWLGFRGVETAYLDGSRNIARGTTKTGADGTAEVRFTALPDKTSGEKPETWFTYHVNVIVTDTAGENRVGERTLNIGDDAMKASVWANDWQTPSAPVSITVKTVTLDEEPLSSAGTLTVHRLVPPDRVHRKDEVPSVRPSYGFFRGFFREIPPEDKPEKELAEPAAWETGEVVQRDPVKTDAKGDAAVNVKLAAGAYRAVLETQNPFGKKITAQRDIIVTDPDAKQFPVRMPFRLSAPSWRMQPGGAFIALWGTGYDTGRALVEIEHRGKTVQRFWTEKGRTQQGLSLKIAEEHRGGFRVYVSQVRENRLYTQAQFVDVPWLNKDLQLKWEHLTSKLEPGAKDTWTLTVAGPDKETVASEVAAVLYDASLDAFSPHFWMDRFWCFYSEAFAGSAIQAQIGDFQPLNTLWTDWWKGYENLAESVRSWAWIDDLDYSMSSGYYHGRSTFELMRRQKNFSDEFDPPPLVPQTMGGGGGGLFGRRGTSTESPSEASAAEAPEGVPAGPPAAALSKNLSGVTPRRNMQETAFFFPHLTTAEDGIVKMSFTMPESVTTWRFFSFAHDKSLRSGFLDGETVTTRELMVQPNPPRFLREGDTVEFTVKITNQTSSPQHGTAQLNFSDAATLAPVDAALGIQKPQQEFTVPAKESRTLAWRVTVPEGQGFLTWKAVAATERMSDGEEGWLPVLSRRILLTESIPLTVRNAGEKEFVFKKLQDSAASATLRHQNLTVGMVSRPAWYAVMALPYLLEYPHECSEQTFNRFYANTLARHIAKSDPKIRRVFDLWRDAQPDAMKSPLEKNAEMKSVMIEETPWLREAAEESRRSLGSLLDDNRLNQERDSLIGKLCDLRTPDGRWPWFPGGPPSDFITLYIVAGFGRLQHLGVQEPVEPAVMALDRLDAWLGREYRDVEKRKAFKEDNFHEMLALYLYGRSFYLEQRPVPEQHQEALNYFLEQARRHWAGLSRMSQAHAALGLLRFGDKKTPALILKSLQERSLHSEELGCYWADRENTWRWNAAPVETQALMIEAFREIARDAQTVEDCQVWLLRQKQMHAWPTTKATADAIYAILLGGGDKLSSNALVSVSLGGREVQPEKIEDGTGFFAKSFNGAEIKPDMGVIKLTKQDGGIAWGSVHWQYLEDISKVTPHEDTPLKVSKTLFTKTNTPAGPELRSMQGKVKVGDELVIRLELRTDRDMEFVHLKDQRPSSVEPVNVLSEYKWQDGLGYYESTRDTASHFFFESLPKGTRVFEYSARVQLRGACQTGIAELQCMYAPEFNSHSAGAVLEVE